MANSNTAMSIRADDIPLNLMDKQIKAEVDPFYPRFWEEKLSAPYSVMRITNQGGVYYEQKPKGIFVCDMGELFGDWIPQNWQANIFQAITDNPQHRFYLLTKQPQNLIKFSPFPENCWVGVTATNPDMFVEAYNRLICIDAKVKFISIEPFLSWGDLYEQYACRLSFLLSHGDYPNNGIDWLIIGACTGNLPDMTLLGERYPDLWLAGHGNKVTAQPKIEWVREIVEAADKAGIPVFLKNNLYPLLGLGGWNDIYHNHWNGTLRQEMPE